MENPSSEEECKTKNVLNLFQKPSIQNFLISSSYELSTFLKNPKIQFQKSPLKILYFEQLNKSDNSLSVQKPRLSKRVIYEHLRFLK